VWIADFRFQIADWGDGLMETIATERTLPASTPVPHRAAEPVTDRSEDYTIVTTVRMKKPLKRRLDERRKREAISLNELSVQALIAWCDHLDALDAAKNNVEGQQP